MKRARTTVTPLMTRAGVPNPGATMNQMKKLLLAVAAVLWFAATAVAQPAPQGRAPEGPYDFILARLAAAEGRFDDALKLMDVVIARNPGNTVLLYERASILMEAG